MNEKCFVGGGYKLLVAMLRASESAFTAFQGRSLMQEKNAEGLTILQDEGGTEKI